MNFIDEALHNCHNGEELVQALADIYKHPDVRIKLRDYPEWINDIIAIIDYDTELQILDCKIEGGIWKETNTMKKL